MSKKFDHTEFDIEEVTITEQQKALGYNIPYFTGTRLTVDNKVKSSFFSYEHCDYAVLDTLPDGNYKALMYCHKYYVND